MNIYFSMADASQILTAGCMRKLCVINYFIRRKENVFLVSIILFMLNILLFMVVYTIYTVQAYHKDIDLQKRM